MKSKASHQDKCAATAICDESQLESGLSDSRNSEYSCWSYRLLRRCLPALNLTKVSISLILVDLAIIWLLLIAFQPLIILLCKNEQLFGPRLVLSQNYSQPDSQRLYNDYSLSRIPRILHQTSPNHTIPEKWAQAQQTCKEVYADFEYKLWTDELSREFLAAQYPWFLDVWQGYAFPIQRADAIRYFILYHYGGIYLDMDTICKEPFPLDQVEARTVPYSAAVFKSTVPTGVSNDFIISTAKHPAFAAAIGRLPYFHHLTRWWARWQPHCSIMISAGPFFITWILKGYLLEQITTSPWAVQVTNATQLDPYIIDLETKSWHHSDAQALMWLGKRPYVWFGLGGVGLLVGLSIINCLLRRWLFSRPSAMNMTQEAKQVKQCKLN